MESGEDHVESVMAHVGLTIRSERAKHGLSQKDLAERIGYTAQGIWKIETGKSDPKLSTLVKIADALETEPAFLIGPGRPMKMSPFLRELFVKALAEAFETGSEEQQEELSVHLTAARKSR